jgi:hypothetical protein
MSSNLNNRLNYKYLTWLLGLLLAVAVPQQAIGGN